MQVKPVEPHLIKKMRGFPKEIHPTIQVRVDSVGFGDGACPKYGCDMKHSPKVDYAFKG